MKNSLKITCVNAVRPQNTDVLTAILDKNTRVNLIPHLEIGDNPDIIQMPAVSLQWVGQRGIDDYAERKRKKVTTGYSIKMAENVLFNVFILKDGTHEYENLYDDLLNISGNLSSQASYLRGAVQNANGYAHTVKNYVETFQHFYGPLTDEQKTWMDENTVSFEHAVEVAKLKAKQNTDNKKSEGNGEEK